MGHQIDFFITYKKLRSAVRKKQYDAVGFSVYDDITQLKNIFDWVRELKDIDPKHVTMVGGPGVDDRSHFFVEGGVDLAVEGEAEKLLPALLNHISRAENGARMRVPWKKVLGRQGAEKIFGPYMFLSPITKTQAGKLRNAYFKRRIIKEDTSIELKVPLSNIAFRTREGEIVKTGIYTKISPQFYLPKYESHKKAWDSKNAQPYPLSLAEFKQQIAPYLTNEEIHELDYPWDLVNPDVGIGIYVNRGCPFLCTYCTVSRIVGRYMNNEKVVGFIEEAHKRGVRHVDFTDDLFFQNTKRAMDLLKRIQEKNLKGLRFAVHTRVERMTPQLLREMKRTGDWLISLGVESLALPQLEVFKKANDPKKYIEDAKRAIDNINKEGLNCTVYIIAESPDISIADMALNLYNFSEMMRDGWLKHRRVPFMDISRRVIPLYNGELTRKYNTLGNYIPLAPKIKDGEIDTSTMYLPITFEYSGEVYDFHKRCEKAGNKRKNSLTSVSYMAFLGKELTRTRDPQAQKFGEKIIENMKLIKSGVNQAIKEDARTLLDEIKNIYEAFPEKAQNIKDAKDIYGRIRTLERRNSKLGSEYHGIPELFPTATHVPNSVATQSFARVLNKIQDIYFAMGVEELRMQDTEHYKRPTVQE